VTRPIFDANADTFDALHERSPFAVDAICMVAARVRDAGGPPSEVHQKLLEEVHSIAKATLFAPVLHAETIQAMSRSNSITPNLINEPLQFLYPAGLTMVG
jgi:hypothetical protein